MSRHPRVLTTLEEDLKQLGLLDEEGPEKDAPKGEPSKSKSTPSRNVGALSDSPDNTGGDEHDEPSGLPHKGDKPAKSPTPAKAPVAMKAEADESDDDSEDEDDKKSKEDEKDDKEESFTPSGASTVAEVVNKLRAGRTVQESNTALDRATALIESATAKLDELNTGRRNESVKAFANIAIIAEMMSKGFGDFASKYEDEEFASAAEALTGLAEEAAEISDVLSSEDEVDDEKVESYFRAQLEALVSSLDLYSDVVEADEHLENDESSDEAGEEAEAIAESDDEDDSEDDSEEDDDSDDKKSKDKEEGVRFKSPLVKKGGKSTGTMGPSTGARAALTMSKAEAYMPYGKGKGPMVSKPGKVGKPAPAKESKK